MTGRLSFELNVSSLVPHSIHGFCANIRRRFHFTSTSFVMNSGKVDSFLLTEAVFENTIFRTEWSQLWWKRWWKFKLYKSIEVRVARTFVTNVLSAKLINEEEDNVKREINCRRRIFIWVTAKGVAANLFQIDSNVLLVKHCAQEFKIVTGLTAFEKGATYLIGEGDEYRSLVADFF